MPVDIAIDLGTYKTVIVNGNKILLEQPTVAAVDSETWEPLCFGDQAKDMIGRTSENTETVLPIQRGIIADYDIAEQMLANYMGKSLGKRLIRPRVVVAMPAGATSIQRRSVANAVENAGGRRVRIIDTAVAAAVGMGVDFWQAGGKMVVDIGAGVTDIAILSAGGIVQCESQPVGSLDFDESIIRYIKKEHNVLIGNLTAEAIKKQIGSVILRKEEVTIKAKGRNLFSGLPEIFDVSSTDVYNAMADTAEQICSAIKGVIERTDPDVIADVISDKIYVTGAGASVNGLEDLLGEYLSGRVKIDRDGAHTVAYGAAMAAKNSYLLRDTENQLRSIEDLIVDDPV